MNMTLREICAAANVSRRAVQGYEKAGLVKPSGKTKRGYLIYDEKTQERIRKIKLYQELGFRNDRDALILHCTKNTSLILRNSLTFQKDFKML